MRCQSQSSALLPHSFRCKPPRRSCRAALSSQERLPEELQFCRPLLSFRADDAPAPKPGGRLRVGMFGGGASGQLDPNLSNTDIDIARAHVLYERLVDFNPDGGLFNQLAEEFSPNSDGSVWKIKLRSGVLWHDGSPFTAQDVVYTLRYVLDPANKAQGGADIAFVKPDKIRALDPMTVEITPESSRSPSCRPVFPAEPSISSRTAPNRSMRRSGPGRLHLRASNVASAASSRAIRITASPSGPTWTSLKSFR